MTYERYLYSTLSKVVSKYIIKLTLISLLDIQNLLEWTDKQVLDKTGKHLDSLQESILQGIWEHLRDTMNDC